MRLSLTVWIAIIAIFLPAAAAQAQEETEQRPFYLVEVVVFTHAGGDPDDWPVSEPSRYDTAMDPARKAFGKRQRAESGSDAEQVQNALSVIETIASLESGETSLSEALLYPAPWLALDELSEPMQQAKTRLEQSGAYRVQAELAWHQPLEQPGDSRNIRIHDDRIIDVDWITLSPTGRPTRSGRAVEQAADLAPSFHYRLDGNLRLRQRQFMHADITLEWRVPETIGPSLWPVRSTPENYVIHRLQQSRTIRPERFEYFDSDWLGALLRVTPYEPSAETETPEPVLQSQEPEAP